MMRPEIDNNVVLVQYKTAYSVQDCLFSTRLLIQYKTAYSVLILKQLVFIFNKVYLQLFHQVISPCHVTWFLQVCLHIRVPNMKQTLRVFHHAMWFLQVGLHIRVPNMKQTLRVFRSTISSKSVFSRFRLILPSKSYVLKWAD